MKSISLEDLTFKYDGELIFSSVNLSIPPAKYELKGGNGVGKSTFLKLLCGLQIPSEGHVKIEGMTDLVSESVNFPSEMDVQTIFSLYERYQRTDVTLRDSLLEVFSFHQYLMTRVSALSQGNCQKLRLILGLSGSGNWLLLDEAFNGLDGNSVVLLNELIAGIDRPTILVDHSNQHVLDISSNLVIENKAICIA